MDFKLSLDISKTKGFYDEKLYEKVKEEVIAAHELLRSKKDLETTF